jgi:CheY-like chemotaxis protein
MPYNILVVDDNPNVATCLADMLRLMGHEVQVTHTPNGALRKLNAGAADVLFLDVNMPGINGLEVCQFIRRDPAIAHLPIVIVSGNEARADLDAAYRAGADYYIVKPAMLEDLEAALHTVTSVGRSVQ